MKVEVDETYFFHRKYHHGRHRCGSWVVGLVERAMGKCWLQIIARCDAATLERFLSDHLLPGTVVVTDAWAGYVNISRINSGVYDHQVVVHAQHFVDPVHADIHTPTIEGLWTQAKRKLRFQSGTSRALFPSYLSSEFQQYRLCIFYVNTCHSWLLGVLSGCRMQIVPTMCPVKILSLIHI